MTQQQPLPPAELIDLIYQAALEPTMWPQLLQGLARVIDVPSDRALSVSNPFGFNDDEPAGLVPLASQEETYDALALRQGQSIAAHFKRATQIARRIHDLERQNEIVSRLVDRLPLGVLLVDSAGRVIQRNNQVEALMAEQGAIAVRDGVVRLKNVAQQQEFDQMLQEMATPRAEGDGSRGLLLQASNPRLLAVLSPLSQWDPTFAGASTTIAVFLITKEPAFAVQKQVLQDLYALTKKEVAIVDWVARGYKVNEIAEQTHVSPHTVRTQLKSIFAKTGTHGQGELINLVLSHSLAMVTHEGEQRARDFDRLILRDGRQMAWQEYGDPDGVPVIYAHSVFGSRMEHFAEVDTARDLGLRLIIPDRPGYGYSDPQEMPSFTTWGEDLRELLDHLGLDRVVLAGYAMGGVFALAAAQVLQDRVAKLYLVSTGDRARDAEDYQEIMPLYRTNLRLAREYPRVHRLFYAIFNQGARKQPEHFLERLGDVLNHSDRELFLSDRFRRHMLLNLDQVFRQDGFNLAADLEMQVRDWGFPLSAVNAPVALWHGERDNYVPLPLARRLVAALPQATLTLKPDAGHYFIYHHFDNFLQQIADEAPALLGD